MSPSSERGGSRLRRVLAVAVTAGLVFALALPSGRAAVPDRVPIAGWKPLPAASKVRVSREARAARKAILGRHALDPRYVTLAWYGVSSFIVTIRGHLLLFDAWEIVGAHKDYVPIGREDLAAIDPEAILIGHGHFDHAADAGYVAGRTGAAVVGSEEICDQAKAYANEDGLAGRFTCAITGTATTPAPGTIQSFRLFEDVAPVRVLQHIHSASEPPSAENPPDPFLPVFDPLPYVEHFQDDPEELQKFMESLDDAQGGTWMYHLTAGAFTLLIGDSAGPIWDSADVRGALDSFPGCVDVMANAILGFDQPVSGLRDPRLYVEHAHPRVFVPSHADAWAPVLSAGQDRYVDEWSTQMAELDHRPQVDFLIDPEDYLAERAYRVADRRWRAPMPGSRCAKR